VDPLDPEVRVILKKYLVHGLKGIGGEGGVAVGTASLKKIGLHLLRMGFIFLYSRPKRNTAERPSSP
jgi:hypothetical protein